MRREPSFLKDILSSCRKIEAIVAATSEDSFLKDEVLTAAVLHHLTVIGEAISRLSVELRERHPEVPWRQSWRYGTGSCMRILIWIGKFSGTRLMAIFLICGGRSSTFWQRIFRNPNPLSDVCTRRNFLGVCTHS
jgi:hypothetical protein